MPNGSDLITAILEKYGLRTVKACPTVPVEISRAVYGAVQQDGDSPISITPGDNRQKQINRAISFGGSNSETAVLHFRVLSPAHHFVALPWYRHESPHGQVYTVLMAWEKKYDIEDYVGGVGAYVPAPGGTGYKLAWTVSELSTMLSELLDGGSSWQDYFGQVGAGSATLIDCWKYPIITLESAIRNVRRY